MARFLKLPPGAWLDERTNSIRGVGDRPVRIVDDPDPVRGAELDEAPENETPGEGEGA
jgi:hypothetical protein